MSAADSSSASSLDGFVTVDAPKPATPEANPDASPGSEPSPENSPGATVQSVPRATPKLGSDAEHELTPNPDPTAEASAGPSLEVSTGEPAPAPGFPRRSDAPLGLKEDVSLTVDGGEVVVVKKAALVLLSETLGDMLEADPPCTALKVKGSATAWRFVADYLTMLNKERVAKFKLNCSETARFAAELLPVAIKYDMPKLLQECEEFFSTWTCFVPSDPSDAGDVKSVDRPSSPVWWFNLAVRYDRPALAEPAIQAMVADPQRAWLVAELLPVAIEAGGPELLQKCEDAAMQWHTFCPDAITQGKDDPTNPVWWIKLATKHNRQGFFWPAIMALYEAPMPPQAPWVQLAAELLSVAIKRDMPELLQRCERVLSLWTGISPDVVTHGKVDDPSNPIWWIDLAAKHDRLALAGPAIRAMFSGYFAAKAALKAFPEKATSMKWSLPRRDLQSWTSAISMVVAHGKRQQGQLWQLVCSLLEGCR